jgi:hypothetical protein
MRKQRNVGNENSTKERKSLKRERTNIKKKDGNVYTSVNSAAWGTCGFHYKYKDMFCTTNRLLLQEECMLKQQPVSNG